MPLLDISGLMVVVGEGPDAERIAAIAERQQWPCALHSPRSVLRSLRTDPTIDLVILVPNGSIELTAELCRSIKFDQRSRFTWVVFFLPAAHTDGGEAAMEAGADECIRNVASDRELVLRLLKARQMKHATDSMEDAEAVITSLANAVEGKDHYTCGHIERVGASSSAIGLRMGLSEAEVMALRQGGIVHDIGKIGIPDQVLNKPGKLTDDEMYIIRRHPLIGYDILKPLRTFHMVLPIVRWHHERPNGKGYPDGIGGADLPLLPRIAAVADVLDALITDRPYRKAFSLEKCREIMTESGRTGDLDPELVQLLFEVAGTEIMLPTVTPPPPNPLMQAA